MANKGMSVDFGDSSDLRAKAQIEHDAAEPDTDQGRQKR
jgi:hypothetical protein